MNLSGRHGTVGGEGKQVSVPVVETGRALMEFGSVSAAWAAVVGTGPRQIDCCPRFGLSTASLAAMASEGPVLVGR